MTKLQLIKAAVTSRAGRQILKMQKNAPTLLLAAGVVGVVGGVVLACRATLKIEKRLDHQEAQVEFIAEEAGTEQISHEDADKQIMAVKISTAVGIARDFAPAIVVLGLSIAALTGSHRMLSQRNAVLTATVTSLHQAYMSYRQRVVEEYGVEVDQAFVLGGQRVAVGERKADGTLELHDQVEISRDPKLSPYTFVFDEQSRNFNKGRGKNLEFLTQAQQWANDKLIFKGHLTLNDVLDLIDLPRTNVGMVTGWVYDRNDNKGDNYISFGIFSNPNQEEVDAVLNGQEKYIILDFNVDGTIYGELGK